mmetsp:Transcript_3793/g.4648  ORF Transcript_3793/g.4648 Transcript_3793/m.4648 type:complete len:162 (+) Transcript_3793:73-558(+)
MSLEGQECFESSEEEVIDVAVELERLRLLYDDFIKRKEKEQRRRTTCRGPTKRQKELYEEGRIKLLCERIQELEEVTRSETASRKPPSPIPICNRLYEKGMEKIKSEKEKMAEKREEEERNSSTQKRGLVTPIPICDRLYEEGMNKLFAERDRSNLVLPAL